MKVHEFERALSRQLHRVADDEVEQALDYYREMFEEMGLQPEDEVPKAYENVTRIAYEIRRDLKATELEREPAKRKPLEVVALVLLAIMALPIGIPLALTLVAVVFALFAAGVAIIFAVLSLAVMMVVDWFVVGPWVPGSGWLTLGVAILGVGVSLLVGSGVVFVTKRLYKAIVKKRTRD